MSLKKQYDKKRPVCKVTFTIPKQISDLINTAHPGGRLQRLEHDRHTNEKA
jgi:hypothetical protein